MAEPIRKSRDASAPTPQNTPASTTVVPQRGTGPTMASIDERGDVFNQDMVSMIKGRLGNLADKPAGHLDSLPPSVKARVAALKALRLKNAEIEAEFQRELLQLEKRFFTKQEPLFSRRARIVAGDEQPTEQEIEAGEKALKDEKEFFGEEQDEASDLEEEEAEPHTQPQEHDSEIAGVPDFWLTALQNVPSLEELIGERDSEILANLVDVRLKYLERPGFALEFEFADNSSFTNRVLTKTYYYQDEIGVTGDFVYDHAEGSDIKWTSPAANTTILIEKRKQRNKHTKATRVIEKELPQKSFFTFFSPPQPPGDDESDEYLEELEDRLEVDFDLGELFKEKLIPRAVDWFTGAALQYEGLAGADFGDSSGSEGEEDDSEGESAPDADGKQPAECNQQ